jgi:simple sugar transport system ATP-binding protein
VSPVSSRVDLPRSGTALVVGEHLSKRFGAIHAVDDVTLEIRAGEILAIVGDNGAGKSTLIKMLAGATIPDGGHIRVDGHVVSRFQGVLEARRHGIETVYQDLGLTNNLDVTANLFLGRELKRRGLLGLLGLMNERAMREMAERELGILGIRVPKVSGMPVKRLSGGQRQAVAVARAILWATKVLLFDEPTAALGVTASRAALDLIRRGRDAGMAIVVVSHILPHIVELADRVLVMRHGRNVAVLNRHEVSQEQLVSLIVGP